MGDPLTDERLEAIEACVTRLGGDYGGAPDLWYLDVQQLQRDVPALLAEVRRLRERDALLTLFVPNVVQLRMGEWETTPPVKKGTSDD